MSRTGRVLAGVFAVAIIASASFAGGVFGARVAVAPAEPAAGLQFGESPARGYDITPVVNNEVVARTGDSDVVRAFQQQFRQVAAQTLPVVVEVNVITRVTRQVQSAPFDFFFGTPRQGPQEREFEQPGMGSGVIVARDGRTVYVITNHHVAGDADQIRIALHDGRSFEGSVVGSDELMDIALLSFETREEVPIAPLGDSDSLRPGDWVFAVGNPLGFQSTITAGIVSATARTAQPGSRMSGVTDYIQTDAAINRGNSGGPLVNLDGEVVGINTWIASQTGGSIGLGFAIPVNNARRAMNDFLAGGQVVYSWLGVQVSSLTETVADELAVTPGAGAFVSGIFEGSPAAESGLLPGDIITRINGTAVDSSSTLVRIVANLEPTIAVPFGIIRNGDALELTVRTGRRTAESGSDASVWPGVTVAPLTSAVMQQLGLASNVNGVVVAGVASGSSAAESLRSGDTITTVNDATIDSIADFYRELNAADNEVRFRIIRQGRELIVGFTRSML